MSQRLSQLKHWLEVTCGLPDAGLEPASEDASFRRYFRVRPRDAATTFVVMDAPPDKEDCRPFLRIAEAMRGTGVHVPVVHASDLAQGFLLLEDLGSRSYLDVLDPASVDALYGDALSALLRFQRGFPVAQLPPYDRALLDREMQLFPDWLLARHLDLRPDPDERVVLQTTFDVLADTALEQPVVGVHRDYHSRNLMLVERANPGIIDFQDAVAGPVTYDLVSLLRDCYVAWPAARVWDWVAGYHADAVATGLVDDIDVQQFARWFDLMGVQRHLKAAGIFARLLHRDGKPGYIRDIPRTLGYIVEVSSRRDEVRALGELIERRVLPALPGAAKSFAVS